jgi:GR25 family glycosyltransferase involved in LPS biosynthesis
MSNLNYQFYCLSFDNPARKENMTRRFKTAGIDCKMYEGVNENDYRLVEKNNLRVWSCMYGHLDMINDFYYNTDKPFGIFCEDDIFIHKELKTLLPNIMTDFYYMNLDVLLLGYLLPFKLDSQMKYQQFQMKYISPNKQIYYEYPDEVWGTQMYMLSRGSAKKLLDKYSFSSGYAERTIHDKSLIHFSADWTLTKNGNRALISQIMATEDNQNHYGHEGQRIFHQNCFNTHFVSELFIV